MLNSAKTEENFQRQFTLIEAILKSKLPQLSTEEILTMFDLKLEAQMQKDVRFYRRYFGEIFLYLSQYEENRNWKGLLILKNRNLDLGSEISYKILLDNHITRLYLEDLSTIENLSPNLALLRLIVAKDSEIKNLGKLVLNSAKTEEDFQRQFTLIEAILKSKLPQLSTEEILTMFDLKTATMPKLDISNNY